MAFKLFLKSGTCVRNEGGVTSAPSAVPSERKLSAVCARCTSERRGENSGAEGTGGRGKFGGGTGGGLRRARRDLKATNRNQMSTNAHSRQTGSYRSAPPILPLRERPPALSDAGTQHSSSRRGTPAGPISTLPLRARPPGPMSVLRCKAMPAFR